MPSALPFLDEEHPIYTKSKAAWKRDEARLYGGDAVLDMLVPFKNEAADSIALRRDTARYTNLPDLHMTTLVGHLSRNAPDYAFGAFGPVRPREEITGPMKLHEQFFYNCDGMGSDGSQYPAWRDAVKRRAGATGHRWVMADMPPIEDLRAIRRRLAPPGAGIAADDSPVTIDEQLAGYRVFLREASPLEWHNWRIARGALMWAVQRVDLEPASDVDESGAAIPVVKGRYLVVRRGYAGLGEKFEEGGWWLFDEEGTQLAHAAGWPKTRGEIPLWPMFAVKDTGLQEREAMSRSLTMEIGQIGVDLMNARSEQRYNLRQAAKTITYLLGCDPQVQGEVVDQLEDQSIVVAVAPVMRADGTVGIPAVWNSASSVIDAQAFQIVLDGGMAEAREIMVKQVTSEPGSSGESKQVGFAEATSPLLATLAETSEEFDNTMLYFVLLLMDQEPDASVTWPREFPLRSVVDDLNTLLDTMTKAGLTSKTLEVKAVIMRATEMGLMDDPGEAVKIKGELEGSADKREERKDQESNMFGQIAGRRQFDLGDEAPPANPPPEPPTPE